MDDRERRRKKVGKRIQRARRRAGYRSAKAFGDVIDRNETTVNHAERGADRVGEPTFELIEDALGWPVGSIWHYIDTGDESRLPQERGVDTGFDLRDDTERMIWRMEGVSEEDRRELITRHREDVSRGVEPRVDVTHPSPLRHDLVPGGEEWVRDVQRRLSPAQFDQLVQILHEVDSPEATPMPAARSDEPPTGS